MDEDQQAKDEPGTPSDSGHLQHSAESDGRTSDRSTGEGVRHRLTGDPSIIVEEESGIAAAESTGKTHVDNDVPAERTAGSG